MTKTKDGRIIHMILESCGRFRIRYQAVSKTKQIQPNQNKRIEINRKKIYIYKYVILERVAGLVAEDMAATLDFLQHTAFSGF